MITPASIDQWQEITDAMREQIRRQIPYMPAMKPEEQEKFIETARSLQVLERDVASQQAEISKRLKLAENAWQD